MHQPVPQEVSVPAAKLGRAIVVTSGKGGVGKTTTTANLGTALAQRGARVALIDADVGLRNLDIVLGLESRVKYHVLDVLEDKVSLDEALVPDKHSPTLVLLAAAQSREKDDVDTEKMRALVQSLRERFDYVLIDCPAGIELGFKNAVVGADEAIVVCTPEVSAVRDVDRVVDRQQGAAVDFGLVVAGEGNDLWLALGQRPLDLRQMVLRQGERHRDRAQLRHRQ